MCEIAGIKFTNCVWNAPVPLSYEQLVDINKSEAGAIVFKTRTLNPTVGEPDNWHLTESSSRNAVALHNDGIDEFITTVKVLKPRKPVFISIYGSVLELRKMIRILNRLDIELLVEWNISCPNAPELVNISKEIIKTLRALSKHPFGIKVGADQNIKKIKKIMDDVDFISAINTVYGYGGRIIHERAVKYVSKLAKKTCTPIIGIGGAENREDVEKFLDAGAIAVEMGTAYLRHGSDVFRKCKQRSRLVNMLFQKGIVQKGRFTLKSGMESDTYVDFRKAFSFPDLWETIILKVLERIKNLEFDLVCGVPSGAIPLASIIALKMGKPLIMCRDKAKEHGTKQLVEGSYNKGDRVLLIEDVVTTGFSLMATADILRGHGLKVNDSLCLLNRAAYPVVPGMTCRSLFRLAELVEEKVNKPIVHHKVKKLQEIITVKKSRVCFSADISDPNELLRVLDLVGPHICMVKLHLDTLKDISEDFIVDLYSLMSKHVFMLFEDRKINDIGKIAQRQYEKIRSIYYPDFITVFLTEEKMCQNLIKNGAGVFIVAQMSSGKLDPMYTRRVIEFSKDNSVCGLITQGKLCDDIMHLTPGVHLTSNGDKLGQNYRTPEDVKKFADIIIVGSGIYSTEDPEQAVIAYKERFGV